MKYVQIVLLSALSITLIACGGSKSNSSATLDSEQNTTNVSRIDLSEYLFRTPTQNNPLTTEFFRTSYVGADGTSLWFDEKGIPAAESESSYSSLKTMKNIIGDIRVDGVESTQTRFKPNGIDTYGIEGPFFVADHANTMITVSESGISKRFSTLSFDQYDDTTLLEKYSWDIPRYIDDGQSIVFNSSNSSMINVSEICSYKLIRTLDLRSLLPSLTSVENEVLEQACQVMSTQDNSFIGSRTRYYQKHVGLIHKVTSLGQGIVHHVISDRRLLNFNQQ